MVTSDYEMTDSQDLISLIPYHNGVLFTFIIDGKIHAMIAFCYTKQKWRQVQLGDPI